jgi:long-chain fatty acid transport protein
VRTNSIFIALLLAVSAHADGFLYNGQSARALGVMNACVAQADDPSAVVFNAGALALMPRRLSASAGATFGGTYNGHFRGDGIAAEERPATEAVPHVYAAMPFGERLAFGAGVNSLFRMRNEWSDPEHFAGRFIATKSRVASTDVTAVASYAVTPALGVGAGVVYRTSTISASRITGALPEEKESSAGFNAGVLYRPFAHWSFALTHRNAIGVFPSQTTGGAAWRPSDKFVFEIDVNRTGWSELREITLGNATFPLNLEDTATLRAGFRHRLSHRTEWSLGYAAERTAQPDETVGPFLHDAQRSTYGASLEFRGVGVAFSWSTNELREIGTNVDGVNGNYRRNFWIVALTVRR